MKSIEKIKITLNAKIKEALKIISDGGIQIAIVVDRKGKLLGTLTDGDIRRGFLKGLDINNSINSIINKNPIVVKKDDTKEKVLKIALKKKIYQIPIVDKNFKIIGLHVLDELIKSKKNNLVVIMAGGKGMRLRPLTKNIPKPMLKVGDKPILQTILEKFIDNGYDNFVICVNYKSKVIIDYFGNGKKFGAQIEYIHEKIRMGTAGALSLLKKKKINEPFFVINGDILININFEKMLNFHQEHNSKATMCIKEYNVALPYGEVRVKKENIYFIEEKPKHKFFVNAGIYILDPKCINLIPKKFYDMTSLFKKMINKKDKIVSFPLEEKWLDIGRLNDYDEANLKYNSIFDK